MYPTSQLIATQLATAVLIHELKESAKDSTEVFLGIAGHFDALRLLNIGWRHQYEHGSR
jgi:hypothetical protein